ncbi:NAD(P)H-hydrate dehydratase [Ferruginibacter sp. HRS2-29]|uniref:NAD(P)H-hydrate dehydratase n=1 Tax=Ferruginibacter sp. HRS2-29 TaxID=2487334 RepID=UPI0020CEAE7E|nr:NAD(P)H-hydrate dehydratase [Ferruginibacter sp. HRS2-29]MCP9752393.1 NAD(P)H-hydrate dehydratase [Ferruginibacter sp. HRS2-29]
MDHPVLLSPEIITSLIKPRAADSHKGTYGHALLVAGNKGRMGAAVLCAEACLRAGTGLLTVNVPETERGILQTAVPEAMLVFRDDEQLDLEVFSAAGIGPALGTGNGSLELLHYYLKNFNRPLLLDADALNLLAANKDIWQSVPFNTVITPHPKEFDRLFGGSMSSEERMEKAIRLSAEHPWVIVLKGHQTLIAHNGNAYLNTTGNAGLAKGGSGDILSGMITALLAQGYQPFDAAKIGVYLHGLAADIALNHQSMESMLARDVIAEIGHAFKMVLKKY